MRIRGFVALSSGVALAVVACGTADGSGVSVVDDIGVPGDPNADSGGKVTADATAVDGTRDDASASPDVVVVADAEDDADAGADAADADGATDAADASDASDAADSSDASDAAGDAGAPGSPCVSYLDCASHVCANGVCALSTCTDGMLDGDETAIDCGGSCAKKCGETAGCKANLDCATGLCTTGHCARATTLVLMHFDGVNAGASFPEERGRAVTVTPGLTTSTIEKKLGTASAYFSDPAMLVRIPYAADLTLGTDDFTIEYWWYPLTFPARGSLYLVTDDVPTTWLFGIGKDLSSALSFTFQNHRSVGSPALGDGFAVAPASLAAGWHHFAATRAGTTFRLFLDGQLVQSVTAAPGPNIVGNPADILVSFTSGGGGTTGYIDELRISSAARYTATFTPQATPFDLD